MNTELLKKIKEAILAEPRNFNMAMWILWDADAPCGTTACIGGWAAVIANELKDPGEQRALQEGHQLGNRLTFENGTEALNLSKMEESRLCYDDNWPEPFRTRYSEASDRDDRQLMAQIAAERIDYFIATDGSDHES